MTPEQHHGNEPRPASGEQFVLTRGGARAVIGSMAAVLREFSVDGVRYTETWPDDMVAPMGCGIVLAPWPNRVADGRWSWNGVTQQLDITEVSRNNAIHGLLRNTAYTVVSRAEDAVTLVAEILPQHGYPFNLDTSVTYALTDSGLQVTHTVTNRGAAAAPFGVGAHPYLRVGDVPVEDVTITVRGATVAPVDDRNLPTGLVAVADAGGPDLRAGQRLGGVNCDVAVTDFELVDGRVEHRLDAPDGSALVLWTDPVFGWAQIYTPPDFPADPAGPRLAVAIEPMTCGVNAFNTGRDVLTVAPGETWSASWGLSPC